MLICQILGIIILITLDSFFISHTKHANHWAMLTITLKYTQELTIITSFVTMLF